jgi:phosphate:Na+ symporter
LKLTKQQNKRLSELKLANRRMVEIIKDTKELEKNVSVFLVSDNEEIKNEYNKFRKKVVKVLRVIYLFRKKEDKDEYFNQLMILKREAKTALKEDNKSLDRLIRKNLITTDMASSLVNDNVTVNDLIKKLIQVAELLYSEKDVILETVINNKIQQ